jgi:hypothetical protein
MRHLRSANTTGKRFINTEIMTVREGKIVEVEGSKSTVGQSPVRPQREVWLVHKLDSDRAKHSLLDLIQNAGDQNDQHDTL